MLPFQKPSRSSAGQNECFPPTKPSFYPATVTTGITHYALHAKSCVKGGALWKRYFFGMCSHTFSKMQNKRHKPSLSPILIYTAYLLIWSSYTISHISRSILLRPHVLYFSKCQMPWRSVLRLRCFR